MEWRDFSKKISKHFSGKAASKDELALYAAVKEGNLSRVKYILNNGVNPNIRGENNLTPAHHAAYWGEVKILEQLIKHDADINADNGNDRGWTPLHSAAISGGLKKRKEVIELLLKNNADINKEDKFGWTPKDYMLLWENDPDAAAEFKNYISKLTVNGAPPREPKKPTDFKTPKH